MQKQWDTPPEGRAGTDAVVDEAGSGRAVGGRQGLIHGRPGGLHSAGAVTGMRSGEMLRLEWKRAEPGQRLVCLRPMDQKSNTSGSVPINDTSKDVLLSRFRFKQTYCEDSRWVFCHKDGTRVQSVKRSFQNACRKAEIKDLRIHVLRHTAVTWLAPEHVREAVTALERSRFGHGDRKGEEGKDAKSLI